MKTVNQNLLDKLKSQTGEFVYGAVLTRPDGQSFGFIEHDVSISTTFNGNSISLQPQRGLKSSITQSNARGVPGHQTFVGFLSSTDFREEELLGGLFEGSEVQIFMLDAAEPPTEIIPGEVIFIGKFFMGEIKVVDGVFQAEIVTLADRLKTSVIEVTSPTCRAKFGDNRCGVNLANYTISTTVQDIPDSKTVVVADDVSGLFMKYGYIQFTGGKLKNIRFDVSNLVGTSELKMFMPFHYYPQVGDPLDVVAGCDKTKNTCSNTYSNIVNFRGEPNLPGADKWKSGAKQIL